MIHIFTGSQHFSILIKLCVNVHGSQTKTQKNTQFSNTDYLLTCVCAYVDEHQSPVNLHLVTQKKQNSQKKKLKGQVNGKKLFCQR